MNSTSVMRRNCEPITIKKRNGNDYNGYTDVRGANSPISSKHSAKPYYV